MNAINQISDNERYARCTRRTMLALAMPAALFALAAFATTATSAPSGDMNQADLDFITQAYNIIIFDREECSLAPTYAQTPEVKEIAAKLLNDANVFAAKLDPIMKARGINPPTQLPTDLRIRLYHIRLNHGLDFDRSFIADHRQLPPLPPATILDNATAKPVQDPANAFLSKEPSYARPG